MGSRFLANLLRGTYAGGAKSRGLKAVIVLILAFVVSFLVAREIFFSTLVFGDYPLVTLRSAPAIGEYVFQSWNRAAYGENYQTPLAYLFLFLFSQLAAFFGTVQVYNLLMNLSFPLSFVAFYFFSRRFCKSFGWRIFGSAVYLINPAVLAYYDTGGFIWTFVFLPFSLSFFMDLLEKHTNRNLAKASLFTGLTMWAFPSLSVALIFTLSAIGLAYLLFDHSKRSFLKATLPRFIAFFVIVLALSASFLYAQNRNSQSPSYGIVSGSVVEDFKFTYGGLKSLENRDALVYNILRLAGNVGSPQVASALGYNDPLSLSNAIGFIIPILAFASIYWFRKTNDNKRAIAAMLVAALALFGLMLLIIALANIDALNGVIENFVFLWTLRNPLKLQLMLAICIIPLLIFSLERITTSAISFLRQKKRLYAGLAFALIFLGTSQIYVYNANFAFNGYAGLEKTYARSDNLEFSYVPDPTLEKIVSDSMSWYDSGTYRGIVLPFDHNAELHIEFTNLLLYADKLGLVTPPSRVLSDALNSGESLKTILSLLSTKYVYVNYDWKNTSFAIIIPNYITDSLLDKNITMLAEKLQAENLTEQQNSGASGNYSKFTVDTALPRLYLSNYPVFASDTSSVGLLNSSVLLSKPFLIQMINTLQYAGQQPDNVSIYAFNVTTQGRYDLYASIDNGGPRVPIFYTINGTTINVTLAMTNTKLNKITQAPLSIDRYELSAGIYADESGTYNVAPFQNISQDSTGTRWIPDYNTSDSSYSNDNGLIKINSGKLLSVDEHENFTLNLDFKPEKFGNDNWNGPQIFFNWQNSSSYIRMIFDNDSKVELYQATPNATKLEGYNYIYIDSKYCNITLGDDWKDNWNEMQLVKNNTSLDVYLNGNYAFTVNDPRIMGTGKIAIGSDLSTSSFRNIIINQDRINGLWVLPAENQSDIPVKILENGPDSYRFEFNQTTGNSPIIVLGENFDPGWEATIDGQPLSSHFEANLYANGWLANTNAGTHEVEIYYKYNGTYQSVVNIDIAIMVALAIVSFLPAKLTKMVQIQWRIRRNRQHN